jgi:molybdopterin-guanine dinucleotide biosynthesis protein A
VTTALLVGVFVGGEGRRMGGVAKGLLPEPNGSRTLLARLLGELEGALPGVPVVLVGRSAAYASHHLPTVQDCPTDVGPIGGLGGLLQVASERGVEQALALACDLPRIHGDLLRRLATEAPGAAALVAHLEDVRNPLIARYHVPRALPVVREVIAAGKRSLQATLDALGTGVHRLPLTAAEAASLMDWDRPEDLLA